MDDLTAFLNARLDEEQRGAQFVRERENGAEVPVTLWLGVPFADRMLREAEAKRAIVDLHGWFSPDVGWQKGERCCDTCGAGQDDVYLTHRWPCGTLKALAAVYSDHPDYQDEWKP